MSRRIFWSTSLSTIILGLFLCTEYAEAASGIPQLAAPIQLVVSTIGGPVLAALGTLALIVCGITIAFSQNHGYDRLGNIIIGLGVAFGATAIIALLYGASGAGASLVVPAASSLAARLLDDAQFFLLHGWLTFLSWKGIRCVQRSRRI